MSAFFWLLLRLFIALMMFIERKRREEFEARFPPISDDEFVALCSDGVCPMVALKVRRIVADALCVEYDRVYPTASFIKDLGAE